MLIIKDSFKVFSLFCACSFDRDNGDGSVTAMCGKRVGKNGRLRCEQRYCPRIAKGYVVSPKPTHNRQSMQCCAVCGYPLNSKNQCINGGCKACAD
jgi:hypothetical protein